MKRELPTIYECPECRSPITAENFFEHSCFIPKARQKAKVSPEPIHNIDYTAVLEKELLRHRLSDHFDLDVEDYHEVATHLNAALQKLHCA